MHGNKKQKFKYRYTIVIPVESATHSNRCSMVCS